MKKIFLVVLSTVIILTFGCEDNLNPFFEKESSFILNCVLKNDRDFQTALLSTSYFVDNFDPYSNLDDHSVKNAYIRIFYDDSVKIFTDTIITNSDSSNRANTFYYNDSFNTKPDTKYNLEAVLNDGRKITAETTSPKTVSFRSTSDLIIPPSNSNSVTIGWNFLEEKLYTAARFKFIYFKNENGVNVRYEKEVPQALIIENGEQKVFFPEPSYNNSITVEMNAFNKALEDISVGDPNKENYTILAFILEILVYDKNLTAYYASKKELGESFSITTNESDYSNIVGGKGIFGSFIKQRKAVKFSLDYIHSFGYIPGLTE